MLLGLSCVVLNGLWVVDRYDTYSTYPKAAFLVMLIGIGFIIMAHGMIRLSQRHAAPEKGKGRSTKGPATKQDRRIYMNQMWRQRKKIGDRLIVFLLIVLVIVFLIDSGLALNLLKPILLVGMTGFAFLFIVQGEYLAKDEDASASNPKYQRFLRLIDYRNHPFSLPLIVYILIILSFLLSKTLELPLSLETSGNPSYVMSLPAGTNLLSVLVFACGFLYMIQHGDVFGIRQANQSRDKLTLIHFLEIIICGATFFIWLFIIIMDWFIG